MTTTVQCKEDFTLNERNAVDISNKFNPIENENLVVLSKDGEKLYDITIKGLKESLPKKENVCTFSEDEEATIFVGEPVLDLMIDTKTNIAEYVPGGQALSQAIAFKKVRKDKRVIFVGNFGADENGNIDEKGKFICDFLENLGIEVIKVLAPNKKTRDNIVLVDDKGRTILNPKKDEEKPEISEEKSNQTVIEVLDRTPNIASIGVDGSLKGIINQLIYSGYCNIVEVDAGRKTLEQQLEMRDIHNIIKYYREYDQYREDKLHMVTSKSYANMVISQIPGFEDKKIIEPKDGNVTEEIMKNNADILEYLQNYEYPYAYLGVTAGSTGCYFIDEDGKVNYLPSYPIENTNGEKFKDNSAGDTFHALLLSAKQDGYSTSYAYQYATIGTAIAGYGKESTAKMNTPTHEEIVSILKNANPFYEEVTEDGIVAWRLGQPRKIIDDEKKLEHKKKVIINYLFLL